MQQVTWLFVTLTNEKGASITKSLDVCVINVMKQMWNSEIEKQPLKVGNNRPVGVKNSLREKVNMRKRERHP